MSTKTRKYLPQVGLSVFFEVLGPSTFGTDCNFSDGRVVRQFSGAIFSHLQVEHVFCFGETQ